MDDGGTALGGVDTYQQTFLIQQTAVDLAPTITLPGTQRLIKNTPLTISTGAFNSIVAADADALSTIEQMTLTATHGTVTLASGSGVTITPPATGTNDTTVTFTGTISQLNAALNGLVFTPDAAFTGHGAGGATIAVSLNDQSSAFGGPITANSTYHIDVVNPPSLVINQLFVNPP